MPALLCMHPSQCIPIASACLPAADNAAANCVWCVEMGLGKTACAVGIVQLNRPPAGWRRNRSFQTLRARDHLCECHCVHDILSVSWYILAASSCLPAWQIQRSCMFVTA